MYFLLPHMSCKKIDLYKYPQVSKWQNLNCEKGWFTSLEAQKVLILCYFNLCIIIRVTTLGFYFSHIF